MSFPSSGRVKMAGLFFATIVLAVLAIPASAQTAGAMANGASADAVSRGDTMVAEHGDPLDAVEGNPAGLAGIHARVLSVSGVGLFATGSYKNSTAYNGHLTGTAGAIPYAAFASQLGHSHWSAALAVTPEELMRVHWKYLDPAGTAGVSYGLQTNNSETVALRSSATLARAFSPKFAAGAGLGLVYNSNTLDAPYTFQEQPELAGLKVLLHLKARGFGWNGNAGAQWQASNRLRLGASWKSATKAPTHGDADGTASALFTALGVGADPTFHYRAEVDNQLPQTAALGGTYEATKRVRLSFEGDWVDWSNAFKKLPIKLKDGSNPVINSVAGSDNLVEFFPFHWRNQGAVRVGAETALTRGWSVRGGYSYMSNPVPDKTLMPLTSAILKNSLSAGASRSSEHWQWSAAYQLSLPVSQSVGKSELLAGEYDNSRVSGMAHAVTVSGRFKF